MSSVNPEVYKVFIIFFKVSYISSNSISFEG